MGVMLRLSKHAGKGLYTRASTGLSMTALFFYNILLMFSSI